MLKDNSLYVICFYLGNCYEAFRNGYFINDGTKICNDISNKNGFINCYKEPEEYYRN